VSKRGACHRVPGLRVYLWLDIDNRTTLEFGFLGEGVEKGMNFCYSVSSKEETV